MKITTGQGLSLEVEDHGSSQGEPLLLVMGLGMQLLGWHEDFVRQLVARGFRVIRFDNRDIGLSQPFDHLGVPSVAWAALRHALGLPVRSHYTLADMADDAAQLLDALGIARAHVCGASMGGMIAQHLAARHPHRVKSLTLMMTTSGARRLPGPTARVRRALLSRPPAGASVQGIVAHAMDFYALIESPSYRSPAGWMAARYELSVRRSHRPQGSTRQLLAVVSDGDRSPLLGRIAAPTRIVHGSADPLVPVAGGHDLARKIRHAAIDVVEGMGHDLPMALWPRFTDNIAAAAQRA